MRLCVSLLFATVLIAGCWTDPVAATEPKAPVANTSTPAASTWKKSPPALTNELAKQLASDLRLGAPITPFRDGIVILDQDAARVKVLCGTDVEREIRTYQ